MKHISIENGYLN